MNRIGTDGTRLEATTHATLGAFLSVLGHKLDVLSPVTVCKATTHSVRLSPSTIFNTDLRHTKQGVGIFLTDKKEQLAG